MAWVPMNSARNAAAEAASNERFCALPVAQACRRVDFDLVEFLPGVVPGSALLLVSGIKCWVNMEVALMPRVYPTRPDYWGIEVVGSVMGCAHEGLVDYSIALPLDLVRGTHGIEILGATKSEKRMLPTAW